MGLIWLPAAEETTGESCPGADRSRRSAGDLSRAAPPGPAPFSRSSTRLQAPPLLTFTISTTSGSDPSLAAPSCAAAVAPAASAGPASSGTTSTSSDSRFFGRTRSREETLELLRDCEALEAREPDRLFGLFGLFLARLAPGLRLREEELLRRDRARLPLPEREARRGEPALRGDRSSPSRRSPSRPSR